MSNEPKPQQPWMWRADLPPMQINEQPLACQPSFDILYQFIDGALDLGQQADVRQHLDDCPDCSLVHDAQAHLKQALASSCRIDPPSGLADKVFAAVLASGGARQLDDEAGELVLPEDALPDDALPDDALPDDALPEEPASELADEPADEPVDKPDGRAAEESGSTEMTTSGSDDRPATETETP